MDKKYYMHFDVTINGSDLIISKDDLISKVYNLKEWSGEPLIDNIAEGFRDYLMSRCGIQSKELTGDYLIENGISIEVPYKNRDKEKFKDSGLTKEEAKGIIEELIKDNWSIFDISDFLGVTDMDVIDILKDKGFIQKMKDMKAKGWDPEELARRYNVPKDVVIKAIDTNKNDPVNHPSHYTDGKIEVIDFITDKNLNFQLGNAVKYICRAGKKDPNKTIEDLKKAQWYLNQWIMHLEENAKSIFD